MTRSFIDETGFAIVDHEGNVFGQCNSIYFSKTVSPQAAERINSPDTAFQQQAQNTQEIPVIDVRKIVADSGEKSLEIHARSEEGSLVIHDALEPDLSFHPSKKDAIHIAAELIEQESPDSWNIMSERSYFGALYGPVFFAVFLGFMLLPTWFYAADLEAGKEVEPVSSFRHRGKSKMAIDLARSIGTTGVIALAGGLVATCTLWAIWGVTHIDCRTTFYLKSQLVQSRESENNRQ